MQNRKGLDFTVYASQMSCRRAESQGDHPMGNDLFRSEMKKSGFLRVLGGFLASLALTASATPETLPMQEHLAACAACHGKDGEGAPGAEYYPHLAGKPAGYLLAQMQGFRDGRRHYPQMVYLMRNWDDRWLRRVAEFYAGLPLVPPQPVTPPPLSPEAQARATQLIHDGDAARGLPACVACHGPELQGMAPSIPALAGLPVDYLIAQLGGWSTGARRAQEPDCMAKVVQQLQPGDIRWLATWISALRPEAGTLPAPAGSWKTPLDCAGVLP